MLNRTGAPAKRRAPQATDQIMSDSRQSVKQAITHSALVPELLQRETAY